MDFRDRAALEKNVSDNGSVTLTWEKAAELVIELQHSTDPDFPEPVVRYRGADPGSVITGLPEGVHHFRIGDTSSGGWSPPLAVTVEFFPKTNIHYVLTNLGISSVYVVGVYTNECVETTVRDACDLGYLVTMIDDGCATVTPELHEASLTTLRDRYARIFSAAEAMETIEREVSGV